jgi:hypothetical protein
MRQARLPGSALPLSLLGGGVVVLGLFADRMRISQMIAALLIAMAPVQFAFFYADYLTDYPRRTSLVFSGNIRGAFEETMKEAQATATPSIYLGRVGPYGKGGIYWIFYMKKYGRDDLAARTVDAGTFDRERVLALKPGSLVVTNAGEGETEAAVDRLIAAGRLSVPVIVSEPDGTRTFLILRRIGG